MASPPYVMLTVYVPATREFAIEMVAVEFVEPAVRVAVPEATLVFVELRILKDKEPVGRATTL